MVVTQLNEWVRKEWGKLYTNAQYLPSDTKEQGHLWRIIFSTITKNTSQKSWAQVLGLLTYQLTLSDSLTSWSFILLIVKCENRFNERQINSISKQHSLFLLGIPPLRIVFSHQTQREQVSRCPRGMFSPRKSLLESSMYVWCTITRRGDCFLFLWFFQVFWTEWIKTWVQWIWKVWAQWGHRCKKLVCTGNLWGNV